MRHTFFKTYSLIMIMLILVLGFGFADDDCALAPMSARISQAAWAPFSGALPYQDLSVAYDHLFAYCCAAEKFVDMSICADPKTPNKIYLKSVFLFEHLVDVGFRHLDLTTIYPGQTVDSGAQLWYDILHPSDPSLALTPLMVEQKYKQNWSLTQIPLIQDQPSDFDHYLSAYTWFSLRDKYYNFCYLAKNAYENKLQPQSQKRAIDVWDQTRSTSFYTACMNTAEQKVSGELVFAQTTMIERSTDTLATSIESYTVANFIKDRLMLVLDKLRSVVTLFATIVKQAPLSKRCAN